MTAFHETFQIVTENRPSFHDVTGEVKEIIARSGVQEGIVVVFSQHTTCSVIIQEDSLDQTDNHNPYLFQDLLNVLEPIIPIYKEGQYLHPGPKCIEQSINIFGETLDQTLNTDAHLRSALMGRSESIPLVGGELQLGDHGHVYFADFDGTRSRRRNIQVQIIGE